jgi:hypothetical protein
MARSTKFFGVGGFAATATIAALLSGCPASHVGDPCVPEDEYKEDFAGFKISEENIESRSFQCQTRICLVNHFQGRVSCPLGQIDRTPCDSDADCTNSKCVATTVQEAIPGAACPGGNECDTANGWRCDARDGVCKLNICPDGTSATCDTTNGYRCDPADGACKRFVCHAPGNCQDQNADYATNLGKDCCIPGSDTPVAVPVCGQCGWGQGTARQTILAGGENPSVYCSCRCGVAAGEPDDPNFNFCDCPSGYVCEEIRKNVGLGDKQITGMYCIKEGTKYNQESECGSLVTNGVYSGTNCKGLASSAH